MNEIKRRAQKRGKIGDGRKRKELRGQEEKRKRDRKKERRGGRRC